MSRCGMGVVARNTVQDGFGAAGYLKWIKLDPTPVRRSFRKTLPGFWLLRDHHTGSARQVPGVGRQSGKSQSERMADRHLNNFPQAIGACVCNAGQRSAGRDGIKILHAYICVWVDVDCRKAAIGGKVGDVRRRSRTHRRAPSPDRITGSYPVAPANDGVTRCLVRSVGKIMKVIDCPASLDDTENEHQHDQHRERSLHQGLSAFVTCMTPEGADNAEPGVLPDCA